MGKINFYNYTFYELHNFLKNHEIKQYVGQQLFNWVYKNDQIEFDKMINISKTSRNLLSNLFYFDHFEIKKILKDKETIKFLFKLNDGNFIETVLMVFNYGYSICVSTQVGCNMGCKFCASGCKNKIRDLTCGEIILQYIEANRYCKKQFNQRINNIVFMGIGEPFDNFQNIIKALHIFVNKYGLGIGARHITISTCGIANKIIPFGNAMPQVNLAISLHAANDNLRSKLMPINNLWKLETLISECKKYYALTKRRLTFEYILLDGINDNIEHAKQLIKLIKGLTCYINLIPYNETFLNNFKRSKHVNEFCNFLNKNGLLTTIRLERGSNILAGCGQLRIQQYDK